MNPIIFLLAVSANTANSFSNANIRALRPHLDLKMNRTPKHLAKLNDGMSIRHAADKTNILQNHLPLVKNIVYRLTTNASSFQYYGRTLDHSQIEDLIQEGSIGLLRAFEKYDPKYETQFSTYATYWVRAYVTRAIQRMEMVKVPHYLEKMIGDIQWILLENPKATVEEIKQQLKRKSSSSSMSSQMIKNVLSIIERRRAGLELQYDDAWMSNKTAKSSSSSTLFNSLSFQDNNDVNLMENEEDRMHFRNILQQFVNGKEMEALSWRYGLLSNADVEHGLSQTTSASSLVRDYEAEAENDLFGPGGILAHSSDIVSSPSMSLPNPLDGVAKQLPPTQGKITFKTNSKIKMTEAYQPTLLQGGRWGEAMSFKEVGEQMRVSAEYGRRLCASALKKLQIAAEEGRLDPGLLC